MADNSYAVPIYRGWPDKPYVVLGSLRFEDSHRNWDEGIFKIAARDAKSRGGDAIVVRYGSEFGVTMIAGALQDSKSLSVNQTTALVIKWKTSAEVAAENATRKQFEQSVSAKNPGIAVRAGIVSSLADFIASQGIRLDSPEAHQLSDEVIAALGAKPDSAGGLTWLFRGALRQSSLTTSASENVYGLARVNLKGGSITIVSTRGPIDVNFSGSLTEGRVAGQMGASAGAAILSMRAEGVYTDDRISLTGQTQTPDGNFQGNFLFSR